MIKVARKMLRQLEDLLDFGEQVCLDGSTEHGFEVTIHYWGPEGMTHFHTPGRTLHQAVDRAFTQRMKMRETECATELPGTEQTK